MNNKIALVTGGSRGLGKSTVLNLASKGVDSIFTYLSRGDDATRVAADVEKLGGKAVALQLDAGNVSNFGDFSERVKKTLHSHWQVNSFDFLVNNAGIGVNELFTETTEAQFDLLMNLHFKGVFFLTQTLLPLINDGGRVVNVSSGLVRFSLPGHSAYAAMKGAIEVLTRYLANELGQRRIVVNSVAPGAIETDFGGGAVRDNEQLNKMIASQTALGRVGLPDDIGGMIASLLSEENRWINGQRIEVSGGIFL
jgi:NAD(P)-dependent dehydrogenase (short-subunit alcohol dehydrogenase family)